MNKITLVAETAFSHDGNFDYLKKQVQDAAKGGVDLVKIQLLFDLKQYFSAGHPFLNQPAGVIFSRQQWDEILELADSLALKVVALPLESTAFNYCLERVSRIHAVELHSVCFHDLHLQQLMKEWPGTKIFGIGGRRLSEVMRVLDALNLNNDEVVLMAGFQSFPTRLEDLELAKLSRFATQTGCIMGYADHTAHDNDTFHQINSFAWLLGARWFEKHLVVKRGESRTDYEAAVDWQEFKQIRNHFQKLFTCLGEGDPEKLNEQEMLYRQREKSLVAATSIAPGDAFRATNLDFKVMPEKIGLSSADVWGLVGHRASRLISAGTPITPEDVE